MKKCGATHPKALQAAVLQNEADYGIALDGDGDRLMMVDRNGKVYDGDSLIYVIAKARAHEGVEIGGVVGTVMTNMAMEIALKEQGVDFCRAKVGDRYVLEQLHQRGWLIGGEASGHIFVHGQTQYRRRHHFRATSFGRIANLESRPCHRLRRLAAVSANQ